MERITAIKQNELRTELARWINGWTFSAFLTLTSPNNYSSLSSIPVKHQSYIDRCFVNAEQRLNLSLAAIGLSILSYGGYIHSHLVITNTASKNFSQKELDTLERSWRYEADAQSITAQDALLDYIVSEKHLERCKGYEIAIFGTEILSSKAG